MPRKKYYHRIRERGLPNPSTVWYHQHLERSRELGRKHAAKRRIEHPEEIRNARRKWGKTRMMFRNKRLAMSINLRVGQCSKCLRRIGYGIKRTAMHHAKGYYMIFPWFGTIELCYSCHARVHKLNESVKLV